MNNRVEIKSFWDYVDFMDSLQYKDIRVRDKIIRNYFIRTNQDKIDFMNNFKEYYKQYIVNLPKEELIIKLILLYEEDEPNYATYVIKPEDKREEKITINNEERYAVYLISPEDNEIPPIDFYKKNPQVKVTERKYENGNTIYDFKDIEIAKENHELNLYHAYILEKELNRLYKADEFDYETRFMHFEYDNERKVYNAFIVTSFRQFDREFLEQIEEINKVLPKPTKYIIYSLYDNELFYIFKRGE